MNSDYALVQLSNGTFSIRSLADGETFHPVAGPVAEAEALYVRQLRLRERAAQVYRPTGSALEALQDANSVGELTVWDVGLGAGGNALTTVKNLSDIAAHLHIVSFDRTLEALRFARQHTSELEFPIGFEHVIDRQLDHQHAEFTHGCLRVNWEIRLGDFPSLLTKAAGGDLPLPVPHAIFFDAFSPARNPEMWTSSLFRNLFDCLDSQRACVLATFSRSTTARVAMLLAGFFVGVGEPVAGKEETTIAANQLELLAKPLDTRWLERANVPASVQQSRETLRAHPQFR